ncbi:MULTISPECIES: hypothetical protein [Vibrio]|uniref:hypothetical protein n=1 Tax=Vibrio TaxID=662 RepID=UPI00111EF675|nr:MULTISPECIES: hypothetical protein [Vibrio]MBS9913344.1 hypothetical protein [Vibrio alginolyticus]MCS0094817.1 hypothetical protein [Vibrio parahaemolyticus]MDW3049468.1 hypothetical protein [Vibrio sp. 1408]HCE2132455.1 hypothetical protein [Vibrio parahaemolyticus]HCE2134028.1 hypothetical protein [Vibrio parahaemolyticus]
MKIWTEINEDVFDCCVCEDDRNHIEKAEYEERDDNGIPYTEMVYWESGCTYCGFKRWQHMGCPEDNNYKDIEK